MDFQNLVRIACWSCRCEILLRVDHEQELRKSHASFYCFNGHANVFNGKSPDQLTIESLRKTVEALTHDRTELRQSADALRREIKLAANACPYCVKRYLWPGTLKRHCKRVHGK